MRRFLLIVCLLPASAFAHSPIVGIGSLYNGVLHPVLVPSHLLALIALGLFIGRQGEHHMRTVLPVFMAALALGLLLAGYEVMEGLEAYVIGLAMSLGILVALAWRPPFFVYLLFAGIVGMTIGMDSLQEGLTGRDRLAGLFGSGVGASLCAIYAAALSEHVTRPWQQIGIRVVGSWISASAFLVLALSMAGPKPDQVDTAKAPTETMTKTQVDSQ